MARGCLCQHLKTARPTFCSGVTQYLGQAKQMGGKEPAANSSSQHPPGMKPMGNGLGIASPTGTLPPREEGSRHGQEGRQSRSATAFKGDHLDPWGGICPTRLCIGNGICALCSVGQPKGK
eukprot:GGOE01062614.1.p2 GENE.GGOE01062614.1~~GGOE01062614.1.p2  ORF type:complete len:121 (-),score=1.23 GGOE01062614.1:623-985(-)